MPNVRPAARTPLTLGTDGALWGEAHAPARQGLPASHNRVEGSETFAAAALATFARRQTVTREIAQWARGSSQRPRSAGLSGNLRGLIYASAEGLRRAGHRVAQPARQAREYTPRRLAS